MLDAIQVQFTAETGYRHRFQFKAGLRNQSFLHATFGADKKNLCIRLVVTDMTGHRQCGLI